jgi:hypothetical protein
VNAFEAVVSVVMEKWPRLSVSGRNAAQPCSIRRSFWYEPLFKLVTGKVAGAFRQALWRLEKGMPKLPGECQPIQNLLVPDAFGH